MDLGQLFWLFLALTMIQPVIAQRLQDRARTMQIRRIEQERGSRVILLAHRQETLGFLGFPFFRYIDVNDAEQVIRAIRLTDPSVPIDLVLHTPGGLVLASLQIARAIARHPGKVTVIVPHYAMSGGTLIALAADEILMSEHAILGPVDPQLGNWPAASVLRAVARKSVDQVDDETLILADQAEMALRQLGEAVRELVADRFDEPSREALVERLSEGRYTHDYAITATEAREVGLPVRTDVPQRFIELMGLYPQPLRRQPTVEYLPGPRRRVPSQAPGDEH
ncbi:MAG: ATP-dependent Clp protease proteolytic subunit [Pseudomonadales bacterium]|jgi:ClpP class serine protease|nr:ATP-dependent Clp protease proteolytic subunit [Pseudomonadales bacterium]